MARRYVHAVQTPLIGSTIIMISLSATFVFLYLFSPRHQESPTENIAVPAVLSGIDSRGAVLQPVQLKINRIDVEATITPVGLTLEGDMDIEENPAQLAWYKHGPKPGEEGSAVIAGHYGWNGDIPSIFNELHKLMKGDEIVVFQADGKTKTFVVTKTEVYEPQQDATYVFKSDDGKAHLNLITCQGAWVDAAQSYTERLVVFTDHVE